MGMMHRFFFVILVAAVGSALAFPGLAAARTALEPTGQEPKCLDLEATRAAIDRDLGRDVPLTVRVMSDGQSITVDIVTEDWSLTDSFFAPACDAMPDAIAAFVASALAPPPDVRMARARDRLLGSQPDPATVRLNERKALLAASLRRFENMTPGRMQLGATIMTVLGSVGVLASVAALQSNYIPDESAVSILGGTLVLTGAGLNILMNPESDYAQLWAIAGLVSATVGVMVGVALDEENTTAIERESLGITAGAWVASWTYYTVDRVRHRPISPTRLRELYQRLDTPAERDALSAADVAAIEREYAREGYASRPWVYSIPLFIGSVWNFTVLRDDLANDTVLLNAITLGLQGLLLCVNDSSYEAYTGRLKVLGLDAQLQVTPLHGGAGLSLTGTF
jgi:hypothetical protein